FVLETACAYQLPVPLDHIRSRFHLLVHRQPLSLSGGQRGLTTDSLEILLNADDLPTVQNFTFGHELVELLFIALRDGAADDWMDDALFTALLDNKEALCEMGAAEIVLPMVLFKPLAIQEPLSFRRARWLADHCRVSLTATVRRILQTDHFNTLFIVWECRHSKQDRVPSRDGQLNLFGPPDAMDDPKKMRVERVFKPPRVSEF